MSPRHCLLLAAALAAGFGPPATAEERRGTVLGFVEDAEGVPLSGVLVSLFGKGIQGSGLVTFTDAAGQFLLPALPAGSYTLRALAGETLAAPAREITVLPNASSVFTLSLVPTADAAKDEAEQNRDKSDAERELRWLLRHKRRSVLEEHGHEAVPEPQTADAAPSPELSERVAAWLADMDGSIELVTSPAQVNAEGSETTATSLGVVRLAGRFADTGHWNLGGLLAESENNTWRMAGEFVIEPGGGHRIEAGTGYGTRYVFAVPGTEDEPRDRRSVGAVFVRDHVDLGDGVAASFGARYSYVGFLDRPNHLDPQAALELRPGSGTLLRASVRYATVTPGGDLLRLSSLKVDPVLAYAVMGENLTAERLLRMEVSFDRRFDTGGLGARVFDERIGDHLVNAFGPEGRSLRIFNGPSLRAHGVGLDVDHDLAPGVRGSLSYTFGRASLDDSERAARLVVSFPEGAFHDLVARLEAVVARSDTRVRFYYRINSLSPESEDGPASPLRTERFEIQLSQGLPFLGDWTRADWDLLLGLRNALYEPGEGGTLDELAVLDPPTRVLGGISVRF